MQAMGSAAVLAKSCVASLVARASAATTSAVRQGHRRAEALAAVQGTASTMYAHPQGLFSVASLSVSLVLSAVAARAAAVARCVDRMVNVAIQGSGAAEVTGQAGFGMVDGTPASLGGTGCSAVCVIYPVSCGCGEHRPRWPSINEQHPSSHLQLLN